MSNGVQQGSSTLFVGDLYITRGPAFYSEPFIPITDANLTRVGSMTLNFVNAFSGTLSYTLNGALVVKTITKQRYGSRSASCVPTSSSRLGLINYQDLWWNANESGWGINITHQDDILFATLFTYDVAGKAFWFVMSSGFRQPDGSYLGDLYRSRGSAFNAVPFIPITPSDLTLVGAMRLSFTNGITGTLTYSVDGITVTKAITRQEFASPATSCTS